MSYDRSGGRKRPDTQECEITMMAHKTKVPLSLVWRIMVRKAGGDADTDLAQGGKPFYRHANQQTTGRGHAEHG